MFSYTIYLVDGFGRQETPFFSFNKLASSVPIRFYVRFHQNCLRRNNPLGMPKPLSRSSLRDGYAFVPNAKTKRPAAASAKQCDCRSLSLPNLFNDSASMLILFFCFEERFDIPFCDKKFPGFVPCFSIFLIGLLLSCEDLSIFSR